MQSITQFDESGKGPSLKRKLEIQIEQIIDEDKHRQWKARKQKAGCTEEGSAEEEEEEELLQEEKATAGKPQLKQH